MGALMINVTGGLFKKIFISEVLKLSTIKVQNVVKRVGITKCFKIFGPGYTGLRGVTKDRVT